MCQILSKHSVFLVNICAAAFLNAFLCLSQTVCEMTVSLSLAESHLCSKLLVVPCGLFPPWSVSGVGVQLFHRHDKWSRNLSHCSLTNRKHTRMLSTSVFHPVGCILPAPVVLARRAANMDWGEDQQVGATGHWGGKAASVGIRPPFHLTRLKETDSLWTRRVFLQVREHTAELTNLYLHSFCTLHEFFEAWMRFTVACAWVHECVGVCSVNLTTKLNTPSKQTDSEV